MRHRLLNQANSDENRRRQVIIGVSQRSRCRRRVVVVGIVVHRYGYGTGRDPIPITIIHKYLYRSLILFSQGIGQATGAGGELVEENVRPWLLW